MTPPDHRRKAASPAGQLLRTAGVVFVFILVGLFFWKHFEGSLDRFGRRSVIQDPAQVLTGQQKELILQFAQSLQSTYGLELAVTIGPEADTAGTDDAKTLAIALNPSAGEARIHFPVLLRTALPKELQASLQSGHFDPYFQSGELGKGLLLCLTRIWEQLISLDPPQ
jgi:hypothetical protein